VVGGCQADYTNFYWLSYTLCGRGAGGGGGSGANGGGFSLTDTLDWVANHIVLPALTDSIGGISLPNLDGLIPELHVSLTNVHSELRGGFVAVYGDLRPTPGVSIVPSIHDTDLNTGAAGDCLVFAAQAVRMDAIDPIQYSWVITDEPNDTVLPVTPLDGYGGRIVEVPVSALTAIDTADGGQSKIAHAKVTARQPAISVGAEADLAFAVPTGPSTNPCAGAGGSSNAVAVPALNNGGAPGC